MSVNGSQGVWGRELYDSPPLCLFSLCLPGIIGVITYRRDTESSLSYSCTVCFLCPGSDCHSVQRGELGTHILTINV